MKVSAKPLPPSGPVMTVVSDAWVDGAQRACPRCCDAELIAIVSNAPAAEAVGGLGHQLRDASARAGVGGPSHLEARSSSGASGGASPGNRVRPTTSAISRAARGPVRRRGRLVRGGDTDVTSLDDAHAQPGVLADDALVDLRGGEAGEAPPLVHQQHLDVIGATS